MPTSAPGRWTFQTLRAQQARRQGYAAMQLVAPIPMPIAADGESGGEGGATGAPRLPSRGWGLPVGVAVAVLVVVAVGVGVGIAAATGAFAGDAAPLTDAEAGAADDSTDAADASASSTGADLFLHTRIAGTKTLWPEGSNGDGSDHLPESSLPGLLFFSHTGTGVVPAGLSGSIAYTDGPDEAAVYARCAALCNDAAKQWTTSDGTAATGACDAFVAWELTLYTGALGPDGANAYCFFLDDANTPYGYYPLQTAMHDLGLRSRIYSKSALTPM